jgi:hypothetical protein
MPYGHLFPEQLKALRPYIEGRDAHDFGCGDFSLSVQLMALGAKSVLAIDKEDWGRPPPIPGLTFQRGYFRDIPLGVDTLFLSWPVNVPDLAVINHARAAKTLIYLGCNTDGTACGSAALFHVMTHRELLVHMPHKRNTLIITGSELSVPRAPTGEEKAALTSDLRIWSFQEVCP